MKCEHKIKLTPEEEKLLNEQIFKILCEGLDVVRARFPNINDLTSEFPPPPKPQQE